MTTPLDLKLAELLSLSARLQLAAQRSRTQTSAAAKQTWPTPSATPKLTAPSAAAISGADGEGAEQDRELADHRRGPLPLRPRRQARERRGSRRRGGAAGAAR